MDRARYMTIAGGHNIYLQEIDAALFKHPQVQDVMTVEIPGEYRGETIKAFVEIVSGATVTADELIAFCRQQLAAY